jgi:hypothetical protein
MRSLRSSLAELQVGGPSRHPHLTSFAACLLLAVAIAGCGEETGVADDARLSVYAEATLCPGAERALAGAGNRAGSFQLQLVCLSSGQKGHRLDLAAIGADARRATEDSTAIAYLGTPRTKPFSRTILESPGIPAIYGSSGATAMSQLLDALAEADDSNTLRESVTESLR